MACGQKALLPSKITQFVYAEQMCAKANIGEVEIQNNIGIRFNMRMFKNSVYAKSAHDLAKFCK